MLPSPNHQNHCVGEPADWSLNVTVSPTFGFDGPTPNAATAGGVTGSGAATVARWFVVEFVPPPLTVRKTVNVPALE